MSKLIRRLVVKYFGGTKNFIIWTAAVILTIYFIDSFVLTHDRLESFVLGGQNKKDVTQMSQGSTEKKEQVALSQSAESNLQEKHVPKLKCGLSETCPAGKFAYYVRSGAGKDEGPTICFDGDYAISPEKKNFNRGVNLIIVNDKTQKIVETRYFDTYVEEAALVRFLKLGVDDDHVMLAASYDEMAYNLKEDGRNWFRLFGSSVIDKVKFRDTFVFLGQRGLTRGSAVEQSTATQRHQHLPLGRKQFASATEISGCIALPMGKLSKVEIQKAQVEDKSSMKFGQNWPNCGLKDPCGTDSFAAYLNTGKGNIEGPSICVNGKYIIAKNLNEGGRGFNVVIVDATKREVTRVGHFDTYAEDSSNLEIFLEMMRPKEIILAVVNDDGSRNLDVHARKLFKQLGSAAIEKLTFRSNFLFVGQKGFDSTTTIEQVEFAGKNGQFPKPLERQMCIPSNLKGSKIKADPLTTKNEKRRKFCNKYDGYGDFCDAQHIDEPLTPASLTDKNLENHPIFSVPIIVIPGLNHNAVRMQLETILMQPGVNLNMVVVMYDQKFPESGALADLFGFKAEILSSSTKYTELIGKGLSKVWEVFPDKKHVIVLEEEVILGPDYLSFMAQCLSVLDQDNSLIGVSGWNENGYKGVSTIPSDVHRVEMFPGLAFMLKRSFYEAQMKNKMTNCCSARSWNGWFGGKLNGYEMLAPDVSRCYRRPYESLSDQADYLTELFNRPRTTNLVANVKLTGLEYLVKDKYEAYLSQMITGGSALDTQHVAECLTGKALGFYIPESKGKTYLIYFEQTDANDFEILRRLCTCFRLFSLANYKPKGLHNGLIRFTYKENTMLLIGSSTPYYKYKSSSAKPVSRTLL